ncbi:MAG TPA: IMP dehydrogenase [Armatimonadota bacterium]|nr:IMP dehydrogenase [Armatimonadota bacterium]
MFEERFVGEGLSFDDVLLVPRRSSVLPREADTSTHLTRSIRLHVPLVSAAMDTVTESALAIALAREGGIGIIHKNLTIERQAYEVDKVKRSEHGVISDPIALAPDHYIRDAIALMERYHISGVPITIEGKLVGILTNRDIRFESNYDQPIRNAMTSENLVTAAVGTTLEQAKALLQQHKIEKLPLVDPDGTLRGLVTIKDIEKARQYPNATKDAGGRLRAGAALGVTADVMDRAAALVEAGVDVVVIDSAHGHSEGVMRAVARVKERFPNLEVIAGNVATPEGARDLIAAGVDAVKVGMGPGSICTTRVVAGIGVPQVTAVLQCSAAAHEAGVPVIADGGIKLSGDLTKAIAAGADCVMIGNMFAGTEESPGDVEIFHNRRFKTYRAMGSLAAMRAGSGDRYFQSGQSKLVPEGIEGRVPYKGPLADIVFQLVGGLRSGMGYCGAKNIHALQTETRFIKITGASLRESHPHDVWITREAPNYTAASSEEEN